MLCPPKPLSWKKKYPPGHTTKHLQGWELHKELTLQDAFSSWEIQEVFFSSRSSQNGCVRSACIFFFFSPQISPKEPRGRLLPVVPTHLQWLITTTQAPTLWLASGGPMRVKGWRRKRWKSPNQLRKEQPVLLEVIRWGIKGTLH